MLQIERVWFARLQWYIKHHWITHRANQSQIKSYERFRDVIKEISK